MDAWFIVKVNMMQNPMKVFWFCYAVTLLVLSYAVRICERPLIRVVTSATVFDFNSIATAIWMMVISIPGVGYGDKYPVTLHGRLIASISFICGTFMLSVLCNSLVIIMDLSSLESKAILVLRKLGVKREIQETAIKMFMHAAKIALRKRKGYNNHTLLFRSLRKSLEYFK